MPIPRLGWAALYVFYGTADYILFDQRTLFPMKNHTALRLSFWAKHNRPLAIAIIVFGKITVGTLGFYLGLGAALEGWTLPLAIKWPLATVAALALLTYPAKSLKKCLGRVAFYRRQKAVDGTLVALGFVILFFAGNLAPAWVASPAIVTQVSTPVPVALSSLEIPRPKVRKELLRSGKFSHWAMAKLKARVERAVVKAKRVVGGDDVAIKILLTFLSLAVALTLGYLVLALACNLSCGGHETLATIVLVFGWATIILGLVLAVRAIWWPRGGREADDRHRRKRPPR